MLQDIFHHPIFGSLLFCLLAQWPAAKVLTHVGLPRGWSFLIWLNLLLPMLGMALLTGVLGHSRWPKLPPLKQDKQKKILLSDHHE